MLYYGQIRLNKGAGLMRKFDYSAFPGALLTPEISNLLSAIHEYRGKQDLYITAPKDILKALFPIRVD